MRGKTTYSAKQYFLKERICNEEFTRTIARVDDRTHVIPLQSVSKIKSFSLGLCYKQMVNSSACTIELWLHLGGLLNTQEARVALG